MSESEVLIGAAHTAWNSASLGFVLVINGLMAFAWVCGHIAILVTAK